MQIFKENYDRLNPQQKEAVDTIDGPVLVVAGPGTGKTQILTLRIANILRTTDVMPENILALTFTDNAAKNMRERLIEFIGVEAYKVKITTFHGFANDVIHNFPQKFAIGKELSQLDDLKKHHIYTKILSNLDPTSTYSEFLTFDQLTETNDISTPLLKPFGAPMLYLSAIVNAIETFKREFITIENIKETINESIELLLGEEQINPRTKKVYGKWTKQYELIRKNIELLHVYREYKKIIEKEGLYDFGDMISYVVEKFKTDDEILAYYQEKFLYILVDEYQDTNGAQNEIIKSIGSWDDVPNIFAVGDDDQSIFRFQGANLSNIMDFRTTYPNSKIVVLKNNYRSNQQILDLATLSINNNSERLVTMVEDLTKDLVGCNKNVESICPIILGKYSSEEAEYYDLATKIKALIDNGVKPSEIGIIYTRHANGEAINRLLKKLEIKTQIVKGENLVEEKIFNQIITLLEVVIDPTNNSKLGELLLLDIFEFNSIDIYKIFAYLRRRKEEKILDIMLDIEKLNDEFGMNNAMLLNSFASKIINWNQINSNNNLRYTIEKVLNDADIQDKLKKARKFNELSVIKTLFDFVEARVKEDNNYKVKNLIKDFETIKENNIQVKVNKIDFEDEGVNLLTAHASKGLEFEYVFIPKLIDKTWGNVRNRNLLKLLNYSGEEIIVDDTSAIQEERRLFFVALTRAKKELHLSYSNQYLDRDLKYKDALPSQFLSEIKSDLIKENEFEGSTEISNEILDLYTIQTPEIILDADQKFFLGEKLRNFKLSASSLNTYLENPEDFMYRYLVNLPFTTNKHLAMGTAVHAALELFFKGLLNGENKGLEYLLLVFDDVLKKEFEYHEDYEGVQVEGNRILVDWYDYSKENLVTPVALEYSFYGHNVYLKDIPLVGKIDKIEWVDKKEKLVKIIDYKTGSAKTKGQIHKPVDGGTESNIYRQLVFYKLLTGLDPLFPYSVSETEIQYIKAKKGKFRSEAFDIPLSDVDTLKEIIYEVMAKVRNLEF